MTERRNDDMTALTAGIDRTWPTWDAHAEILRRVQACRMDLDWELQQSLTDQLLEELGL